MENANAKRDPIPARIDPKANLTLRPPELTDSFIRYTIAKETIHPPKAEIDEIIFRKRYGPAIRIGLIFAALIIFAVISWIRFLG